jgi:hypothetical protein
MTSAAIRLLIEGELPSFANATARLDSQPFTAAGLCGKVVQIDSWTYTCINWRRQLHHIRAWADKYKGHVLTGIGVHGPEFGFENNIDSVRFAANDMHIHDPIAVDKDYVTYEVDGGQPFVARQRRRGPDTGISTNEKTTKGETSI